MEYDKINNLLGSESENLSKFVTREYADAYILVNGSITVTAAAGGNNIGDKKN